MIISHLFIIIYHHNKNKYHQNKKKYHQHKYGIYNHINMGYHLPLSFCHFNLQPYKNEIFKKYS